MERYSVWRDAPTGIAPFIPPTPPRNEEGNLATLALIPVGWIIAVVRLLLIAVLVIVKLLLVEVLLLFAPWPVVHDILSGFYYIQSETPRSRIKPRVKPGAQSQEKLVIANWSSPLDIIYLSFRYNCKYFLLPVFERKPDDASSKSNAKSPRIPVIGLVRVGFISALARVGRPPLYGKQASNFFPTLHDAMQGTRLPMVVFPEGTTSNNRGLLRFLAIPLGGMRTLSPEVRVVSLKYEPPSPVLPTVTAPIPSIMNPLGHLFRINATLPLPRTLLVRSLPASDNPSFAGAGGKDAEFWQSAATAMAAVSRLKPTQTQGAEEKESFLQYQRLTAS